MADEEIGFATLPNQIHREVASRGFELNLLVTGRAGLGKSTFVNALFSCGLYEEDEDDAVPAMRIPSTTSVETTTVDLEEGGVPLRLTVIDTPGFGMGIDNSKCWKPITDVIEERFQKFEQADSQLERNDMSDSRVHCCFYFLEPCTHGLKALDIEALRSLHHRVNVIPVIGKADSLTAEECALLKQRVLSTLEEAGIETYRFPDESEDPEAADDSIVQQAKNCLPFAICGRRREYPWGTIEVDNPEHSDFTLMRDLVIRTYMQHLIDVTNDVHYERYRSNKLAGLSLTTSMKRNSRMPNLDHNIMEQLEKERLQQSKKLQRMEEEMTAVFNEKVKAQEEKLKLEESEILNEHDALKRELDERRAAIRAKREELERERQEFEAKRGEDDKKKKGRFGLHG